jgi:hypothetical protein
MTEDTMNGDKASQIKKYFAPFPKWAIVVIIIGVLFLASQNAAGIFIGLAVIGLGIWGIYSWSQRPSDHQMDTWTKEGLKKLHERALEKMGLDQSELISEPVAVYGPRFWNIAGAEVGVKKGKDGVVRFIPLGVTIINFTQNQLVAYQCALDLTTGHPLHESTDEYFYRDVVSVSTQSKSVTWDRVVLNTKAISKGPLAKLVVGGKLQFNAAEMFVLTTSGGTSIEVVLRDPKLIESAGGGSIPTDMADKAVQTVRKMLREKKASSAQA